MRVLPWNQGGGQVPLASSKKKNKSSARASALLLCACCSSLKKQQAKEEDVKSFPKNKGKLEAEATSALLHFQPAPVLNNSNSNSNKNDDNGSSSTVAMLPSGIVSPPPPPVAATGILDGYVAQESERGTHCEGFSVHVPLKSSLKKPEPAVCCADRNAVGANEGARMDGGAAADPLSAQKRRVQWNDLHGLELVHIREFEPSESGSDDDDDDVNQGCSCIIQ